jgi:hypothetical protein
LAVWAVHWAVSIYTFKAIYSALGEGYAASV